MIDKITKDTPEKTEEAQLTCWIAEVRKLAEEHMNDMKHYLEAAEDLQRMPKRQALANPSQNSNTMGGYKPCGSAALATLNSCLHLFCITTPINIEHFHILLMSHPNQALVESACQGLREGFWPWATTVISAAPVIIDNASLQRITNSHHIKFV